MGDAEGSAELGGSAVEVAEAAEALGLADADAVVRDGDGQGGVVGGELDDELAGVGVFDGVGD